MKAETYKMMTSELIKILQQKLDQNGDLPVRFSEEENQFDNFGSSIPAGGVVTIMNSDDEPCYEIVMSSWSMREMDL